MKVKGSGRARITHSTQKVVRQTKEDQASIHSSGNPVKRFFLSAKLLHISGYDRTVHPPKRKNNQEVIFVDDNRRSYDCSRVKFCSLEHIEGGA